MALLPAVAQIQDPVQFKTELKTISDTEAQIVFTGKIDAGWHVYSTDLPSGGPISATFNVDKIEGVELVGKLTPQGKEIENFDKVFEMKLRYFENTAIFIQKLKITGATYMIEGYMEFGACNDETVCLLLKFLSLSPEKELPLLLQARLLNPQNRNSHNGSSCSGNSYCNYRNR